MQQVQLAFLIEIAGKNQFSAFRPAPPPTRRIPGQIVFRVAAGSSARATGCALPSKLQSADRRAARLTDRRNRRGREHRPHCTARRVAGPRDKRVRSKVREEVATIARNAPSRSSGENARSSSSILPARAHSRTGALRLDRHHANAGAGVEQAGRSWVRRLCLRPRPGTAALRAS